MNIIYFLNLRGKIQEGRRIKYIGFCRRQNYNLGDCRMVEKTFVDKKIEFKKDFISYLDDDGTVKNQYVIIIENSACGVKFKFDSTDTKSIFIPLHRVLKIKSTGEQDG
jgi:uncharacterized protein (UPF0248 family)